MDLGAYVNIENLGPVMSAAGISVDRLRGIRLMKFEDPVTNEQLEERIRREIKDGDIQWLQQHMWNGWSSSNADKDHPAFTWKTFCEEIEQEDGSIKEYKHREIIDVDFTKVHGEDRKILKFNHKKIRKAYEEQFGLWNKYAGKDVLYIHSRGGGGNRSWCNTNELRNHPRYLSDIDDSYDCTYCDLYFDISDIDLDKVFKK